MIIFQHKFDQEAEVYGVYWGNGCRYYFTIPTPDFGGFSAISENDSKIVDATFTDRFYLRKGDSGNDMFLHWAAHEGDLVLGLIDHESEAMAEFALRLKANYRKDERLPRSPPLDILYKSNKYSKASDQDGDYHFCPSCFDANVKSNDYDEAIRCPNCSEVYNCLT